MSKQAKVIVHPNVDLDAIACVVASGVPLAAVEFVGSSKAIEASKDIRILDHPAGEKGRLDPDGRRHAAVLSMAEAAKWPRRLLDEIDEADSTGFVREPRFSLQEIVAGIRAFLRTAYAGDELDSAVIATMRPVLLGLIELGRGEEEVRRLIESGQVELSTFRHDGSPVVVAVLPPDPPPVLGVVLNRDYDVTLAIYADGHNLGVTRYPGRQRPDLRELAERLPGWFVHSAGFLAAWGSRKAPATEPPPAGTPRNPGALLRLLEEVFGDDTRKTRK